MKNDKKIVLNFGHCAEVLDKEIMIGRDTTVDGKRKQFTFNPWLNEYSVWVASDTEKGYSVCVDGGQAVEELLKVYNEL